MIQLFAKNKNFRNYLIFTVFNNIGAGMFGIFMMWVVHSTYQNPFYTGIAGTMLAVSNMAHFIIGPFVDRRDKVTLIRAAVLVRLCVVGTLLAVTLTTAPEAWFIFLVMFVFNATTMFCAPAEFAYLPRIVSGGEDLVKANAFIRIAGTAAGLGIGVFLYMALAETAGAAFELAYTVNAAVLLLAFIISMTIRKAPIKATQTHSFKTYFAELKEGLLFVKSGAVKLLVLAFLATSVFGNFAYVNLPMFAQIHTGMAQGYIILSALSMVGGIVGSYIFRIVGHKHEVWKIIVAGLIAAGIARIIFVHVIAADFGRSLFIVILYVGLNSMTGMLFGTLMQKLPRKNMIARVDTIITSLFGVTAAVGSFLGGIAGTHLPNVDMIFIIQGISYIAIGACLCLSKRIRSLPKIGEVNN